jgi:hypothetical protein
MEGKRNRFFFFLFYFFLFPVRRGSWKVENSTQKINSRFFPIASLSPSTLKTIINRIWHGRLLAPQQAGERVGAAAVRQGGRERDVGRFLTSFCVFLVSLGSPTTPPPKILFSPSTFFFSSMRVARVLAPLLLCCPSVLRGHRAARASILSPPLNFQFSFDYPGSVPSLPLFFAAPALECKKKNVLFICPLQGCRTRVSSVF